MNLNDCFAQGLLKKEAPDKAKAHQSLIIADDKLAKAEHLHNLQVYDMALINAYSAMFHGARALLFRDGIREKSHYGLFIYFKEKYGDKIEQKFLTELNALRLERHEIFYGLEKNESTKSESESILATAKSFVKKIKQMI